MRSSEWAKAFPDDCDECGHRLCENGGDILVNGVGWVGECVPRWLEKDRRLLRAVHVGFDAWRHWKHGCLAAFYPTPSPALGNLILMVDDAAREYQEDLTERQRPPQ